MSRSKSGVFILTVAVMALTMGITQKGMAQVLTDKMKELLKKNASFGLTNYPVSIWNYVNLKEDGEHFTEKEMDSLLDAGINVPQSPDFDPNDPAQKAQILKMLDWAHKRNMKLVLRDPRCIAESDPTGKHAKDGYKERAQAAIKDFGSHPALFGFYIGDEGTSDGLWECQRILKALAPNLNHYYNFLPVCSSSDEGHEKYIDDYVAKGTPDLLGYDCYTQMTMTGPMLDDYYNNLRLFRAASLRNGLPFWNTPLCIGHNQYLCPDYTDIRWQFNTSVAAGANGIVWFFYYLPRPAGNYRLAPIDEFWEKTQAYTDMRRVQRSFHRSYGNLFNGLVSTRVSFFPKAFGGGETWKPNELLTGLWPAYDGDCPILIGEFADAQERRYLMAVNNSKTKIDRVLFKFPLKTKIYSFRYGAEGKEYVENDGSQPDKDCVPVWIWLAPGQEFVCRVEFQK